MYAIRSYYDKAKEYYSTLIAEEEGNRDALDEAARVFAATGQEDKAAPLWKKLLQVDPENDEYHRQLLSHYRKTAESSEALPRITSYNVCYTKLLRLGSPSGGGRNETILSRIS